MRGDNAPGPRATRGLSIGWKLTLVLTGATLIPMSALTIWDAVQGRRDILALTDQRLLVRAQTTAEAIEVYLGERQRDAGRMSQGPVLRPFMEQGAGLSEAERRPIRAGFESHRRAYGYLRIALLTPDGAPALSVGEPIATGGSLSQQAFHEALAGRVAVSDPFFAGPDGPYVLEVAAPVSDASGPVRGAILFALPFAGIAAIVQADPGRAGTGSTGVLLDGQMIRIAHAAGAGFIGRPLDQLAPESIQALTRDARFGRTTGELVTVPTGHRAFARQLAALRQGGGRSALSELVPLGSEKLSRAAAALLQTLPWIYYVAVPYDTFLAPARAGARRNFIVLAVATAGCALLAWWLGGIMARRLGRLADTTEHLAAGDFEARASAVPADEIGRVAASFNAMASGLQERDRQLEAARTVAEEILRELDLGRLLALITRRAADLLDAPAGALYLWDEAEQVLVPRAWHGIGDWLGEVRQRPGEGMAGVVAQRRAGIRVNDYATWEFAVPLLRERTGATAILGEPLLYRDRLLGAIVIINLETPRHFSAEDSRRLALFSAQAAIAIENARLFLQEQERRRQVEAVRAVSEEITRELDLRKLLGLITRRAADLVGAPSGTLYLWDEAAEALIPQAWHGIGEWVGEIHLRLGEGTAGYIAQRRAGVIVNDYPNWPHASPIFRERTGTTATLGEPLLYRDRLLGVLVINNLGTGRSFTPQDQDTLALLAAQAGIAIENARLLREEQEKRQQLEALRGVTAEITRELNLTALLELIHRRAAELVGAVSGTIWTWDETEQLLIPQAWHGRGEWMRNLRFRLGEGLGGAVAQRRQGMIVNDYQHWPHAHPMILERTKITSVLGEPLLYHDELLGVITLDNEGIDRPFTEEDRALLALFAAQAAIAIENAHLVEQRFSQMVALSEALRKLDVTQPWEVFLRGMAEIVREAVGARYAALAILGPDGRMAHLIPVGLNPAEAEQMARIGLPEGRGLLGHVLDVSRPVRLEDMGRHPQSVGFPLHHVPMRRFLGMRIALHERVIGAIYLTRPPDAGLFTEADERLVEAFAANAAVAIANARTYQEVQEARRELEAKTKELEAFTYTVSHDLKAPLRGIDGFSRALQEDYGDRLDAEGVRYLENVRAATRRMDDLIEDLLKYSRLERRTIRQSRVDLAALCQSILEDRRPEVEARRLTVRLSMAAPQIDAEAEGLREAVANLMDNAIKFSKPGGTISVSSAVLDGVPRAGAGAETAAPPGAEPAAGAGHVVVRVQDEGIGFDMKYHDRIFEIFQRLHRAEDYEGTGVGLAIVKKVAERHGGRAWAASEPGQGSTFYFAIPVRGGGAR